VAAVAAAVAAPAWWAMRFALAEPGRCTMLAYWAGLLAVSLPAMHRVAASRHLPTIIIRKVSLGDAPHAPACQPPAGQGAYDAQGCLKAGMDKQLLRQPVGSCTTGKCECMLLKQYRDRP